MLSERERHQLATIEHDLETSDPGLSALFTGLARRRRSMPGRPVLYARSMVGLGVLLMVTGVLLTLDAVFVQGLVAASLGAAWWAWIAMPSTDAGGDGPGRGTGPGRAAGLR